MTIIYRKLKRVRQLQDYGVDKQQQQPQYRNNYSSVATTKPQSWQSTNKLQSDTKIMHHVTTAAANKSCFALPHLATPFLLVTSRGARRCHLSGRRRANPCGDDSRTSAQRQFIFIVSRPPSLPLLLSVVVGCFIFLFSFNLFCFIDFNYF